MNLVGRTSYLRFFSLTVAGAIAFGCGMTSGLQDRPCPCAEGYTCCASSNVCVPNGGDCADPDSGPPSLLPDGAASAKSPKTTDAAARLDGGSPSDASACVPVSLAPTDAGGSASSCPDVDASGTCVPHVVAVGNDWVPPIAAHQDQCTDKQMHDLYDLCLGPGLDDNACNAFFANPANTLCQKCLLTPSTAAAYGPLIQDNSTFTFAFNVPGCVALLEPCNLDCAKAMRHADDCANQACHSCTVTDQASADAFDTCTSTAKACGCDELHEAACANALQGSDHPASVCFAKDFSSGYDIVAHLICGR